MLSFCPTQSYNSPPCMYQRMRIIQSSSSNTSQMLTMLGWSSRTSISISFLAVRKSAWYSLAANTCRLSFLTARFTVQLEPSALYDRYVRLFRTVRTAHKHSLKIMPIRTIFSYIIKYTTITQIITYYYIAKQMRGRDEDKVTGDCINAVFQGFFDKQALEEEQTLEGLGIVIDDEFNFMMSHWKSSMLNGESFLRTSCGNIIYGAFEQSTPVGMVAIHKDGFKIFLNRINLKNRTIEWYKDLAVFDQNNSIFYLLEISKKDDQETTIDPKLSLSETSRYDKAKVQWKVKIIQRCPLKSDGTPTLTTKLIKKFDRKMQYSKGDYTPKEQNQINLLSSTLGNAFQKASFITARTYLKDMAKQNANIALNRYKQSNEQQQTIFLSLSNSKSTRQNEKQLGVTISLTYDYVKCLGAYNKEGNLNGLGVQYRKNGQSFVGIFKQNILSKQYKYNSASSKNVSTYPIRELLIQEHLKSLNYVHNSIYLSEISMVTGLASKITKYIQYFEKQLEKRNINYNDTPSNQSVTSQFMNIYKYVDLNREKYQDSASSRQQLVSNVSEKDNKKPGFILTKSNNKSAQKSPTKQQQHSPSPAQSKSPLRNVRITGKIYHEGGRSSKQISYSRQYAKLKLNQATYRRDNQY